MKILIVDDHKDLAEIWKAFLAPLHAQIEVALTMYEAMEAMRKIPPPDLVFLDLLLPDTRDAEATLSQIQAIKEKNENAVVIVVTGKISESLPVIAKAMGADSFQFKLQIDSQTALFRVVKSALERKVSEGMKPLEATAHMIEHLTALLSTSPTLVP